MAGSVATPNGPPGGPLVVHTKSPATASDAIARMMRTSPATSFIGVWRLYGRNVNGVASAAALDLLANRLHLGMLEAEELGDPPRELVLDRGELAVGIDDAPDHLQEAQALLA